jgi:dolichol-phosphate mannosyltransferase
MANPILSIIVPTYNERDNIAVFYKKLNQVLENLDISWEVLFVDDDSPDGTIGAIKQLISEGAKVRYLHRIGRRGLSSACIEGIENSQSQLVAVMDADLQHDETLLPAMYKALANNVCDIVIGSRYLDTSSIANNWGFGRKLISKVAVFLSRLLCSTEISDPMSGFFMVKRDAYEKTIPYLSGKGFKILLDILSSSPTPLKVKELGFKFGIRSAGESKMSPLIAFEYIAMIIEKYFGLYIPVKFLQFSFVGSIGAVVHLLSLGAAFRVFHITFIYAQTLAALVAMVSNFYLNDRLTFNYAKRSGSRFIFGLIKFLIICGLGASINVLIASHLFELGFPWILSGIAGIAFVSVWNYSLSILFIWN